MRGGIIEPSAERWVSVFMRASAVGAAQKFLCALRFAAREPAAQGRILYLRFTARPRCPRSRARGGPEGSDIARPAEFLVDTSGTVRWTNFTEDIRIRAKADEMLAAARGMK